MGMRDERSLALNDPKEVASAIDAEFCALHVQNTPSERAVLRRYSRMLKKANPEFILAVLLVQHPRWARSPELQVSNILPNGIKR